MRIKLLQCGDLHLDAPFTSLSDAEGIPGLRRRDLKLALERIVALADSAHADMLLICGDLYEHGYARKSTLHYICDQFFRIPGIPVIIIPGNHDPAVPESYYSGFAWPQNVHILTGANRFYELPDKGTRVYCDLSPSGGLDRSFINVLMYHGTLDMPFSGDAFQPVKSGEIEASGFDYCALGHFHTRIFAAGSEKNIFNAGSPEPLGFDEEGEHGAILAEVEKKPGGVSEIRMEFLKLCRRRFVNLNVSIEGCLHDEQAAEAVAAAIEGSGCREDLYRVSLCGYVAHDYRPDAELIRELLREKAFYIRLKDCTIPDYDFDRIAGEPGLRGLFVKKMLARAAAAAGEEDRQLIMRALYYGMEAIDEGKVCI